MGALQPSSTSSMIKALVLLPWLPWPWAPLSQRLSPLLILTTATMALVITDMLATPMPTVATTTAKGLLSLLLPPSLLLIPTTGTTAFAITATLATLMPMALLSTARGLLKLPQPPILTTATTALATTVMLATLTPMVVTTMESKKE